MKMARTKVIKSTSHEIRAMEFDSKTYFAIHDILAICGCAWPTKWVQNARDSVVEELEMKKLSFPMMTKKGHRVFPMWFVDGNHAQDALDMLHCSDDIRKWLVEEVFTYRFPSTEKKPENTLPAKQAESVSDASPRSIEARIDSLLFELLDIKRALDRMN